jgi:hypothetical protein
VRAIRTGLAAAAILGALVTSPRSGRAQNPTFPSEVELVTVDAIVLGENGRPVRGLTRGDFTLSEDGKLQDIVSFEAFDGTEAAEETPARFSLVASNTRAPEDRAGAFVLLVDDLGIDARRLPRLVKALASVLQGSFRAGDDVTLATASGSLWWGHPGRNGGPWHAPRRRGAPARADQAPTPARSSSICPTRPSSWLARACARAWTSWRSRARRSRSATPS